MSRPGGEGSLATGDAAAHALQATMGDAWVSTRLIDRLALAHDASHFLQTPSAVAYANDAAEVAQALKVCHESGLPVTFRSGGTSLSGQAQSDGLLLETRRHFTGIEVLHGGLRVRVQPGATVRAVNARLAAYGRKLGPDPASEIACTVGGVVANNSSGMESGIVHNAYNTLESAVIVLASGATIDTGSPGADVHLRAVLPDVWAGLLRLRERVRSNPTSRDVIAHQYSIKNTMGYSVNAFLDFNRPVDMLAHLLVGSEGTLGFLAEVTMRTVAVPKHVATTLLVFEDLHRAAEAIAPISATGVLSLELMDAGALRAAQGTQGVDPFIAGIEVAGHTALLADLGAADERELDSAAWSLTRCVESLPVVASSGLVRDAATRARLWGTRKGLYTAVAGARPRGSTALLEDIAVPVAALPTAIEELTGSLAAHGYADAVIFGHAKDGNLHFLISPDLNDPRQLRIYEAFTEQLVDLVLGHRGTLKAEHGTGHIMAPYVRRQFGDELYDVMTEVKRLLDPTSTLNPGVVLSNDPHAHTRHIKSLPVVDEAVDACVECGFCETVCPSAGATTTPRQRIVLMREISARPTDERRELIADFEYAGVQTCAADSLCRTVCPVGIDTGAVMKDRRAAALGAATHAVGRSAARNFGATTQGLRLVVGLTSRIPSRARAIASRQLRRHLGTEWIPDVSGELPRPGKRRRGRRTSASPDAVYLPSCVNEIFGPASEQRPLSDAVLHLAELAGVDLLIPDEIRRMCCATPWSSKGLVAGADEMREVTTAIIDRATDGGRLPVVVDASSCAHGYGSTAAGRPSAGTVDAVTFVRKHILPNLRVDQRLGRIALHPTCSSVHLGNGDDLLALARACADVVVVPSSWGCCGFAGDRGMLHPELTAEATRSQAAEITDRDYDAYASHNRTCELAMTQATGRTYVHVLQLLASLAGPAEGASRNDDASDRKDR